MKAKPKKNEYEPSQIDIKNIRKIRKKDAISICFFNNKGGVGKTTLVANLAANMAINFDLKILVIDADPQCNLTQYVLSDEDFYTSYSNLELNNSIYNIIHPLSIGQGYQDELPIIKSEKFGFDIIIGDPRLALKEDLLSQDWRDAKAGGIRGLRTTFVFSDLIKKSKDYDLIFFDMGPSLGAINRAILLATSGFIVPMSVDIFSIWALKNIGNALSTWRRELNFGLSMAESPTDEEISNHLLNNKLKFFGYVVQQHKEKSENGKLRTVQAYQEIKKNLPANVEKYLTEYYSNIPSFLPHLGDIKHLASLAPKSQTEHTPMISINAKGSYTTMRKQARDTFKSISQNLLNNVSHSIS